jgi:hypothetical protein
MSSGNGTEGFVYILVNPAFPNLVKIGKTTVSPSSRAKEVSRGTGVPAEFQVAWACEVVDCHSTERLLHSKLDLHRFRSNREFFEIAIEKAISECASICESRRVAIDGNNSFPVPTQAPTLDAETQTDGSPGLASIDAASRRTVGLVAAQDIDLTRWVTGATPENSAAILRYVQVVIEVSPGILGKIRDDRKIIFVPKAFEMRSQHKNLTTIKAGKRHLDLRIIDDLDRLQEGKFERYHESMVESYRVRLENLVSRLSIRVASGP